jgi:hypothetical protein
MLKNREILFSQGFDLAISSFEDDIKNLELIARHIIDERRIIFFENKDNFAIAIRERNMAAIAFLLEHECNLHRISKESFKKFYNIKGYQEYLHSQGRAFLKKIMNSIDSNDLEYFKLLVQHIHPDIINLPMKNPRSTCPESHNTILDIIHNRVLWSDICERHEHTQEFLQALIPFLIRHGALTYQELIALSTPRDKNYGFKLPKDYHETGFIIKDETNQFCFWVNPTI